MNTKKGQLIIIHVHGLVLAANLISSTAWRIRDASPVSAVAITLTRVLRDQRYPLAHISRHSGNPRKALVAPTICASACTIAAIYRSFRHLCGVCRSQRDGPQSRRSRRMHGTVFRAVFLENNRMWGRRAGRAAVGRLLPFRICPVRRQPRRSIARHGRKRRRSIDIGLEVSHPPAVGAITVHRYQ